MAPPRPGRARNAARDTESALRVRRELLRQVFAVAGPGIAVNCALALGLAFVYRDKVDAMVLGVWLGAMLLFNATRWWMVRHYRDVTDAAQAVIAERGYAIALALVGAAWGWITIRSIGSPALYVGTAILAAVLGLAGGAIAFFGSIASLYAAYVVPLIGLPAVYLIALGTGSSVSVGVMALLATTVLLRTCVVYRTRMAEGVRARMDNEILVAELRDAVARTGDANAILEREAQERREAEGAHLAAVEEAQRANAAKSEFLATMSHEIRTPLNAIVGFSELLAERTLPEAERDYAERIHAASLSLLALVNDVLDFSKIEAGKLELDEAPFDLAQVLRRAAGANEFNARRKNIAFVTHIAPATPLRLMGDATRLAQILTNLAGNAVKFTASGKVRVAVDSAPGQDADRALLRFTVSDTGIGIPADKQQMIFDAFAQADHSTTRHFGGTGLGLAICKRLALLMGGDVALTSVPGQGSVFAVTLPFKIDAHAETRFAESAVAAPGALAGKRVLVVDDNPINLKLVALMLQKLGLDSETADSGADAVALADEESFDAVLMDIEMPGMNGFEACRRIHSIQQQMPVIALTAHATTEIAAASAAAGMCGYLTKPVTTPALRKALSEALDS